MVLTENVKLITLAITLILFFVKVQMCLSHTFFTNFTLATSNSENIYAIILSNEKSNSTLAYLLKN